MAGDFRAQNWKAMTAELQAVFRTISIDDWSLIPCDAVFLCIHSFHSFHERERER